jgi:chaperonin GroEL (HSP60 family)
MEAFGMLGNGSEEKGEQARMSSFVGAIVIGDLVKTTLGPRGMDKYEAKNQFFNIRKKKKKN